MDPVRRLTRRQLVIRATAASGALALAACTPTTNTAQTAQPSPSLAIRRGGTVTWAQWDKNDDLDPATPTGAASLEILGNVLDTLILLDDDQKIYPLLATDWSSAADGKRFTFTLRQDVKFHDGSPLTASAVKRTWDRILDPATKAAGVIGLFGPLDKIEAPDAKTVVVSFKDPYPFFPLQLWRPYFGILSPKQVDELKPGQKATRLSGSGPSKLLNPRPDPFR